MFRWQLSYDKALEQYKEQCVYYKKQVPYMLFGGTSDGVSQMKALAKSFKTQILLGNKVYTAIPHGTLGRVCSSGTLKNLFLFLLIIIPHRL